MLIELNEKEFGEDFFFEKLLRQLRNLSNGKNIEIDLSKIGWMNDFQYTALPLILSYIKHDLKRDIKVSYPLPDLFSQDKTFAYLSSSGFFDLLRELSIPISVARNTTATAYDSAPLMQFQSFTNLVSRQTDDIKGQRFLYDLTANLKNLKDLLEEEVLGKTDVAHQLSRVITKELIENINQHSEATAALIRCRYIKNSTEIKRNYADKNIENYFRYFEDTPFFILSVSDNGKGLIETLKEKYRSATFIPNETENLKMMLDNTPTWWLQRAFSIHNVKHDKRRDRVGLDAVIKTVSDYNGLLYIRTHDAGLVRSAIPGKEFAVAPHANCQYVWGTHYVFYLPAIEKKKAALPSIPLQNQYPSSGMHSYGDLSKINMETIDISYTFKRYLFSKDVEVSYKHSEKTIQQIEEAIKIVLDKKDHILQIDFANAFHTHVHDYVFILDSMFSKYNKEFTSRIILRNVLDDVLMDIESSEFAKKLWKNKTPLIAFNQRDHISFIGCEEKVFTELERLVVDKTLKMNNLSSTTQTVINNNKFMLSTTTSEGIELAYVIPFADIFKTNFNNLVATEIHESEALVDGHFVINDDFHVDKYLIPHLIFQNPALCRHYAKQIAILLNYKKPDILLSYSSTGIIMFWYLKEFYFPDLKLSIINSPNDISHSYGAHISKGQNVLILTDVHLTGTLMRKLKKYAIDQAKKEDAVIAAISICDASGNLNNSDGDIVALFSEPLIKSFAVNSCHCQKDNTPISCVAAPEARSALPSVYQKQNANILSYKEKKDRINNYSVDIIEPVERGKIFPSGIDDKDLSQFQIDKYWEYFQTAFQLGHVERNHIHFDHYDIPERLLFNKQTALDIDNSVKRFTWSFKHHIDYVVYPKDLTAAYLAHLVAGKFLNKPIVVEARQVSNGYLALPANFIKKLKDKKVIIVDDACNTGITLKELVGLINLYEGTVEGVFTITNRNSPENEMALRRLVPKVATAYRLNLGVYPKGSCPSCTTISRLDALKSTACTKKFENYLENKIKRLQVKDYERN